jgi:hypothetical protein
MIRLLPLALVLPAAAAAAQPRLASAPVASTQAAALFDRDWVLANWALKKFDGNGDILLSPGEVEAAAAEFRRIADTNGDGRVTPDEYRAGREFILARY